MSEKIAAQLATVIASFEPLGKQKRETQKTLLAAMLRTKKTEVRSGDRVFVIKNVKKARKPSTTPIWWLGTMLSTKETTTVSTFRSLSLSSRANGTSP